MNITERLKKVIKYLIGQDIIDNQRTLAKKMGITESYLSQVINQKTPITNDFISALCLLENSLDKDWILTGKGSMLNTDTIVNCVNDNENTEYYQDVVDATEEDLENCNNCQYRIPFIPDSYVRSPAVNIKDLIKTKSSELRHSSLRDIIGDDINYYQRVTTNAMAPDFMPGDILLIKFIPRSNVISGGVYILDSTVKGCMVRQIDFDESTYTLHASNPDYRDLTLNKSDIMSFGRVVCLLRTNFNLSPANISNQSIIKDKTDQIDKLIDEQSKLIDEIIRQNKRQDTLIDMHRDLVKTFTNTINTFNIKTNGTINVETKD